MIKNPIIKGFNPDPSIIRIGKDYYIATSTFEWWPGVNIYHSKDLKNWRLHSRPLNKRSMLDLNGVPDGGGVWAPDISYDGKRVYLLYTNVRERGPMMQTENFLITADDINGEWSEPIYLNSMGFDPSLFHDSDGRKWLVCLNNHYGKNQRFNGLYIQEYDAERKVLIGKPQQFYREPNGELVEGAHIYNFGGTYYLLKAQGGTGERHSAQLSRAASLFGPWEDSGEILLHARDNPALPLQKAGHGDIVETPEGDIYMVHLAARYSSHNHCYFGRETCIQQLKWGMDGWLYLKGGGQNPHELVPEPKNATESRFLKDHGIYDFKNKKMPESFQSLRLPLKERATFTEKGLRLKGCDGLNSRFEQTLLARRIDRRKAEIITCLSFEPENEKHLAGLVLIYDTRHWHYLYVTRSDDGVKEVCALSCDNGVLSYPAKPVEIQEDGVIELKADIDGEKLRFFAHYGKVSCQVGGIFDMNILSDEHVYLGFTGAMVGICCQDLLKKEKCADFHWFKYIPCEDEKYE